jgi:hypothetical protein
MPLNQADNSKKYAIELLRDSRRGINVSLQKVLAQGA